MVAKGRDIGEPPDRMTNNDRYRQLLRGAFGEQWAAICGLPEPDRHAAILRIMGLQGESPRDRAWPTEGGNEPAREPGRDPSGTYRPDVVKQVYEELRAAGKIQPGE